MIRRVFTASKERNGFEGEILVEFDLNTKVMRVALQPFHWGSYGPSVPQLRSEDDNA